MSSGKPKKMKPIKKVKSSKKKIFEWQGSTLPGHGSVMRRFFPNL